MKTMIYLLAGAFLWTSCKNMISSGQSGENTESIVTQETMLIDSLEKKLIASDNELERIGLHRQITDLKFKHATDDEKTGLFNDFTTFLYVELKNLNEKEFGYLEHYYEYRMNENGDHIELHDSIKQKERSYREVGLEFKEMGEGIVSIAPSAALFENYLKQLPASYQEYWQLLRDAENVVADAGLIVTWRELGDLIARCEAYANKYPDHIGFFKVLAEDYQFLQNVYITGTDNTSIVDETGKLDPDLKAEWMRFGKAFPNSPTTSLIKIALAEKNYKDRYAIYEKIYDAQLKSNDPLMREYNK